MDDLFPCGVFGLTDALRKFDGITQVKLHSSAIDQMT
jgi:DNA-directed RNA polymerase specialized sigma subunit